VGWSKYPTPLFAVDTAKHFVFKGLHVDTMAISFTINTIFS